VRPAAGTQLALAAGLAVLAGLSGCGAPEAGHDGPVAADTVRGTVRVVGADPATRVVVRTDGATVAVAGAAADALRRVNGLVVMVRGRLADGRMDASAFRVREADGVPAADGVLEIDGRDAVLVTADGERLRFSPVPTALRARAGARVWIAGEVGAEPQAWGVIRAPRVR
jgi:hypothetical protein